MQTGPRLERSSTAFHAGRPDCTDDIMRCDTRIWVARPPYLRTRGSEFLFWIDLEDLLRQQQNI